jgi:hypothetical protein
MWGEIVAALRRAITASLTSPVSQSHHVLPEPLRSTAPMPLPAGAVFRRDPLGDKPPQLCPRLDPGPFRGHRSGHGPQAAFQVDF